MHERLRVAVGVSLFLALFPVSGFAGPLRPATFEEYVGIAWYSAIGPQSSVPELVTLSVSNADLANRGSGNGFARASGIQPVTAETELHLDGGSSPSGFGATTYVQTTYQFMVQSLVPGPPELIELVFGASGSVSVDSNQPVGQTFARLTSPFGQFEATNQDPYLGGLTGSFSFNVSKTASLLSDTPYDLTLYVYSHGQGSGSGYFFDSHAFLDPTIQFVAPQTASTHIVVFSPGIVAPQGPAVPEPASLWLLAMGLGALSARGLRRRR